MRATRPSDEKAAGHAGDRLAAYVARVVAEAPPLTAAQADRLALLLRGARRQDADRAGAA